MPTTSRPQNKSNLFFNKPTIAMDQKRCRPSGHGRQYICAPIYDGRGLHVDYLGYVPALWALGVSPSGTAALSNFQGAAYHTALRNVPSPPMDSTWYKIYW